MHQIEDQLDIVLERIKNGEHIASVAFGKNRETQEQIYFAATFVNALARLQKKPVPEPTMRRLYLNIRAKAGLWQSFISAISLRALSISLASIVIILSVTFYTAAQSLPGDILFPVKKAYETNVIKLASDPETRLRFEINLTNKRLLEAQEVMARKDNTSQIAAMNELASQTKSTLEKFKQAAADPQTAAKVTKDPTIINNFTEISKAQEILAVSINSNSKSAQESNNETKKNLNEIKNIIAAASSEQIAVELPAIKNLAYTGSVKNINIKENTIIVDKNIFITDEKTVIKADSGEKLTLGDINVGDQLIIKGVLNKDNKNIAESITIKLNKDETSDITGSEIKSDKLDKDKTDKSDKNKDKDRIDKVDKKEQKTLASDVKGSADDKRAKIQKDKEQDLKQDSKEGQTQPDKDQPENFVDPAKPRDTFGDFVMETPVHVELR